jgi:HSP20 family molecular chaperone IbpA
VPKGLRPLVARRAYELYEKRGRAEGPAADDWSQAEAETIFEILVGLMKSNKGLNLYAGTCGACAGGLEICVEPRRLTVTGRVPTQSTHRTRSGRTPVHVFRVINLPVEVDPSKVTARLNNGMLEIETAPREVELKPHNRRSDGC